MPPLLLAVTHGDKTLVCLLLQYEADPNTKGPTGQTPLHQAIAVTNVDMIQTLLSYKADVNVRDPSGLTALQHANMVGNSEIIGLLENNNVIIEETCYSSGGIYKNDSWLYKICVLFVLLYNF